MSQEHFCPVCRAPIKREISDFLSTKMHLQMALATLTISLVVYLVEGIWVAVGSLFSYLLFWAAAEFFHGVKMRQAAKCSVCNFDPILYRRDWRAARKKVEDRLNTIVDDVKEQMKSQRPAPKNSPTAAVKPADLADRKTAKPALQK